MYIHILVRIYTYLPLVQSTLSAKKPITDIINNPGYWNSIPESIPPATPFLSKPIANET